MASIEEERRQSLQAADWIASGGRKSTFTPPQKPEKRPLVLLPEDEIEKIDSKKKVDQEALRLRQRYAESTFNDKAESPAGAKGAFQIMPKTYKEYAQKMGEEGDLLDPDYNGRLRDFIWNDLYNSYTATAGNPPDSVRVAKTLAMYNRGRTAVADWLADQKRAGVDIYNSTDWVDKMPWPETRDYINFNLFKKDIEGTSKTNEKYEKARKEKGY